MEERHEIIEFPPDSPVKIFLHRLGSVNHHWHSSLEILFVLNGTLQAVVDGHACTLQDDDILLINSNAIHSLSSEGCELIACQISYRQFPFLPERTFCCNSAEPGSNSASDFRRLKILLARLMQVNSAEANPVSTLYIVSALLHELEQHFLSAGPAQTRSREVLNRLSGITEYIRKHYKEALTLTQIAGHEHFSVSYMSRFFKENMGMNFTEYYNNVRLDYAVNDLIRTDHPISSVASDNGFPDARTFVSAFKKQYHMLPSDYRKQHAAASILSGTLPEINYLAVTNSDALSKLAGYLDPESGIDPRPGHPAGEETAARRVSVSCRARGKRLRHTFRHLCCVGSVHDLNSAEVQRMLAEIQARTPFRYIRFHGLFNSDSMIYDETASGTPVFRFSTIDRLFDFLLGIRLKPVLQLSFTPDALASDPEETSYYIGYNTSPPKDFDMWCLLVERLLRHLIARYSLQEVLTWPIYLWNEPDMFGFPERSTFFELYRRTFETVRNVHAGFQIGTPTLMLFHDDYYGFCRDFFDFCREHNCMPDCLNINYYSDVFDIATLYENFAAGISQSRLPENADAFSDYLDLLPDRADGFGVSSLPIHLTEWNLTVNHRNLINDTCYKACYLAKNILENYDRTESIGYWSLTDYISELQPSDHLFHGGMGLYTVNGIPKPPYYVTCFLFALGDHFLGQGDGWFAAKNDSSGQIQIILYNYSHYTRLFASGENFDLTLTNRYTIFPDAKPVRFSVMVNDLSAPCCLLKETFVNREHGSAFDSWIEMGAPENLHPEDITYLKEISRPGRYIHNMRPENGRLSIDVRLKPFEVRLITVDAAEE